MRDRGGVIKQLVELTKRWNPLPRSQQLECARIGRERDAIGGKGLVIEAYNAAMLLIRFRTFRRHPKLLGRRRPIGSDYTL